jgi:hypothetical protein
VKFSYRLQLRPNQFLRQSHNGNCGGRESRLGLSYDAVERPRKEINASDDVAEALNAASEFDDQYNWSGIQSILKLLQSVVPKI